MMKSILSEQIVYIRFFGNVNHETVPKLVNIIQEKFNAGIKKFVIFISSEGGSTFYGISAYNFLKGLPIEITTHNFGSVNSSAAAIFCAGTKRYCVPQGRFLIHPVTWSFSNPSNITEDQLGENLKSLKQEMDNIAGIIANTTEKTKDEIIQIMKNRTNLNPDESITFGLVHEIRDELVPEGVEILRVD